ncbi:sulfate ABC transporter permease subunit CysT [Oryzibacter oryziterrae]|uniref:sulfate ABC transporter permease subunit CysT n=1 Tax=Oryzibacter oryziterrae TaxID=2766474 RepID=UPI001EFFAAE6|nr:sulfate ABC transporter permease subunit CysT [Oryzibacter oryziterrae]
MRLVTPSVIPGFRITMAFTLAYLFAIVLLPIGALVVKASSLGFSEFVTLAGDPRTLAALRLSFLTSMAAAAFNVPFGLLVAWVLVRYDFPGRKLLDAMIDLPFALPTAVAGIALTALYAPNGYIGALAAKAGIKIAFTPFGVFVALVFVGMPFIVRTVQPVLAEVDREIEEAAATLGAGRLRAVISVVLPILVPSLLTGYALSLARAIGEYGSVIFIAGNIPYVSEIAPLLIVIKLEEYDYAGATAVAALMLAISFAMLLAINLIQAFARRRYGRV